MNLLIHSNLQIDSVKLAKTLNELHEIGEMESYLKTLGLGLTTDDDGNIFVEASGEKDPSNLFYFYKLSSKRL